MILKYNKGDEMLNIKVHDKSIVTIEKPIFVRGTVGEKVAIYCDEEWGNRLKTVVFKRLGYCGKPIVEYIGAVEKTQIDIPHEILHESGQFYIGVYSTMGVETTPTLWSEAFNIEYGTDTDGIAPQPPTPSEYSKLIQLAEETKEIANSVREDADNGVFDGDAYILTEEDKVEIAEKAFSPVVKIENNTLYLSSTGISPEVEIINGTLKLK